MPYPCDFDGRQTAVRQAPGDSAAVNFARSVGRLKPRIRAAWVRFKAVSTLSRTLRRFDPAASEAVFARWVAG